MDNPALYVFLAVLGASLLWRAWMLRREPVPACPNCAQPGAIGRVGTKPLRADFYTVADAHGGNAEPAVTFRVSYACSHCGHRWAQMERKTR